MKTFRTEHPNPQWFRKNYQNLNGVWEFEVDSSASGEERQAWKKEKLDGKINVPFCPESVLSGVGNKDFKNGVLYRRIFEISAKNAGKCVYITFGAVDYECAVYVNGKKIGTHKGGYTSFTMEITDAVTVGKNELFLCVKDDLRSGLQPSGKQSHQLDSYGCFYTRTTGIWQTVYLEFVEKGGTIQSAKYYPDIVNDTVRIEADVTENGTFCATALFDGKVVGRGKVQSCFGKATLTLKLSEKHLWEVGKGNLYRLILSYNEDKVYSYFGLRDTRFEGNRYLLNGKTVFLRTVLDQGFYPDGIYTAPSKEALEHDIDLSLSCGFNGARLHQKVFEPLFLYYADVKGYLVFGEYPNWGLDLKRQEASHIFNREWKEALERDFNHPSIIGWCPLNETWEYDPRSQRSHAIESVYEYTKALDKTRPCIDTSGNYHAIDELFDVHDYDQDEKTFRERYDILNREGKEQRKRNGKIHIEYENVKPFFGFAYTGQPIFVSEYGGIQWSTKTDDKAWGYGNGPKSEQEYKDRYQGLTEALLKNDEITGFCYTQLTDVEQEQNGVFTYEREAKFSPDFFKKVNTQKAEIEK